MNLRELLEKRAKLVHEARALLEKAEGEKRDLNADEKAQWDRMMAEVAALTDQIQRGQQLQGLEAELGRPLNEPIKPEPGTDGRGGTTDPRESVEYRSAYRKWLASENGRIGAAEMRALQADVDSLGGYLLAPMQMVRDLIKAVDDQVFIRQWATVMQVTGAGSLGVPTIEANPADATWTGEVSTVPEDTSMSLGRRELKPTLLAKGIRVSRKLLRMAPDAEGIVRDRLAYKFGITWEKAGLVGDGASEPLGVFTASPSGIPIGRDVSEGNTTTAITFDGLIAAKYALKGQYWPKARWLFHRDALKQIALIKNAVTGEYTWRESARVGEPDRVLGLPIAMSEYTPSTFTAGLYVGILGDFSFYWIADSLAMEIQRLEELYAGTSQVGFIGRLESDGMPVLAEAFVRVKLATG